MTKQTIADIIREETGVKGTHAKEVADKIVDTMIETLVDGEEIRIPGFGIFKVIQKAERISRNPQTGEKMTVPAKKAVKFSASSTLKKEIQM